MKNIIITKHFESPCGTLLLGSFGDELCLCDWRGQKDRTVVEDRVRKYLNAESAEGDSDVLTQAAIQLTEYFAGKRTEFDIPMRFVGTLFQQAVWRGLQNIGYGHTETYSEQAEAIGKPRAVRAVASANGANALQIFVPCHRVVGSNGALSGYAGGLDAKRFLIELEKENSQTTVCRAEPEMKNEEIKMNRFANARSLGLPLGSVADKNWYVQRMASNSAVPLVEPPHL